MTRHTSLKFPIDEGAAEAASGIGQQGIDRPPLGRRQQAVDSFQRRQIGFEGLNIHLRRLQFARSVVDRGLVGKTAANTKGKIPPDTS
jgi:hypothetical protein